MSKKKRNRNPVMVTWRDSATAGAKWVDRENLKTFRTDIIKSVGFIGRQDKDQLLIYTDKGGSQIGSLLAIPSECVISVTPLKRKRRK